MVGAVLLHIQGAWRTGVRNRGVQALFVLALGVLLISWVTGSFSGRQPQTVALDVGISLIRLLGALLAVFWVQELLVRDVERKTTFWILVYPVQRASYLLGRSLGVFLLLGVYVLIMTGVLAASIWLIGLGGYQQGHPLVLDWNVVPVFSLIALDLMVVAGFSIVLAAGATVPVLPFFAGLGLAFAARMLGSVQAYLLLQADQSNQLSVAFVNALSWLLPDLSRLDIRDAILYGTPISLADSGLSALYAVTYLLVLLLLAVAWFGRREFE